MRTDFIETLVELAQDDQSIVMLTADLGWSVLEPFANAYPDRFFNVGVAEQNMLGIATGLAREGYRPFAYSIATFSSMRCYEQFRDGPVLHQLPVRVIGIGGGFAYGHAGPTHYAIEDLTIARTQPGVTVLAPADKAQTRRVIRATQEMPGPAYIRLDKTNDPEIEGLGERFALDCPEVIRPGSEVLVLATGSISQEANRAAELLRTESIDAGFAVMAHLSFHGSDALAQLLSEYATVVTVEEGFAVGGLGSLVAETIAQCGLKTRLSICGVTVPLISCTGSRDYMRRLHQLDAASIADGARSLVHKPQSRRFAA